MMYDKSLNSAEAVSGRNSVDKPASLDIAGLKNRRI